MGFAGAAQGAGGGGRNRTGVHGFAGRCITTLPPRRWALIGAGDESRTRDLNLGKVALYQLSYSRARLLLISTTVRSPQF